MSQIDWLQDDNLEFPPVQNALRSPNGLLAVGGDLHPDRLLKAYANGIFPWYEEGQPILWWSPDPRMCLRPSSVHISRSLGKLLVQQRYRISMDSCFTQVISACAEVRLEGPGTWISPAMQNAYIELHRLGYAHSVEVWAEDDLVGGLYGIALGRLFFGESMFSVRSNASKIAFVCLCRQLQAWDFTLIDCQMPTAHLASLGAAEIPRENFLDILSSNRDANPRIGRWKLEIDPTQIGSAAG